MVMMPPDTACFAAVAARVTIAAPLENAPAIRLDYRTAGDTRQWSVEVAWSGI
jgi:hypothetical protein